MQSQHPRANNMCGQNSGRRPRQGLRPHPACRTMAWSDEWGWDHVLDPSHMPTVRASIWHTAQPHTIYLSHMVRKIGHRCKRPKQNILLVPTNKNININIINVNTSDNALHFIPMQCKCLFMNDVLNWCQSTRFSWFHCSRIPWYRTT